MYFSNRCGQILIIPQLYVGSVKEYIDNDLLVRIFDAFLKSFDGGVSGVGDLLLIVCIIIVILGSKYIACIQLILIYRSVFFPAVEGEAVSDSGTDLNVLGNACCFGFCIFREAECAEVCLCPFSTVGGDGTDLPGAVKHHSTGVVVKKCTVFAIVCYQRVEAFVEVALPYPILDLLACKDKCRRSEGTFLGISCIKFSISGVTSYQIHIVHGACPLGAVCQ